jgi:glycine betaine catabolism B
MMAGKGFVRVANKNDLKEGGLLKIVMFDSNENEQNILYKDKFDEWSAKNKNLKIIYTITDDNVNSVGWKGEKGRIDKAMITRHLTKSDLDNSIFYVCGPPGMLKAT